MLEKVERACFFITNFDINGQRRPKNAKFHLTLRVLECKYQVRVPKEWQYWTFIASIRHFSRLPENMHKE